MPADQAIALSVPEAARMLGVSRATVFKLIHRSDFPVMRIGGRTLVHRERLKAWAEAQTMGKEDDYGSTGQND